MSTRYPVKDIEFIADFAAYARSRGDAWYDYNNPGQCACCQFLRDTGRAEVPRVVSSDWRDGLQSAKRFPLPKGLDAALVAEGEGDWVFSALATRLEALICNAPVVARVSGADEQVSG